MLFALLSPESAIVTATALGLTLNLLVLLPEHGRSTGPSAEIVAAATVAMGIGGAVPGSVCGLLVLRALPKPGLQVGVGVAIIATALLGVRAQTAAAKPASGTLRLALGFSTGA